MMPPMKSLSGCRHDIAQALDIIWVQAGVLKSATEAGVVPMFQLRSAVGCHIFSCVGRGSRRPLYESVRFAMAEDEACLEVKGMMARSQIG